VQSAVGFLQLQQDDVDQDSQGEHQHGGRLLLGQLRQRASSPEAGAIGSVLSIATLGYACGCQQQPSKPSTSARLRTPEQRVDPYIPNHCQK
jgi:hypothetical protein